MKTILVPTQNISAMPSALELAVLLAGGDLKRTVSPLRTASMRAR